MHITNIYEAKTQLSKLIQEALQGEEVIISKAGKPLVRLVPFQTQAIARKPGYWKGKVKISKDFDKLPSNILDAFKGEKE